MAEVTQYLVYLAAGAVGENRTHLGTLTVGTDVFEVLPNLAPGWLDHIIVYTRSLLAEQSTPSSLIISDTVSNILDLNFTDLDLDATQVV